MFSSKGGALAVPESVLDAIRLGVWNFEPTEVDSREFDSTQASPGSGEKLAVLADRVQRGLPLWHPSDRTDRGIGIEDD
jgi:hypothetical protein